MSGLAGEAAALVYVLGIRVHNQLSPARKVCHLGITEHAIHFQRSGATFEPTLKRMKSRAQGDDLTLHPCRTNVMSNIAFVLDQFDEQHNMRDDEEISVDLEAQ